MEDRWEPAAEVSVVVEVSGIFAFLTLTFFLASGFQGLVTLKWEPSRWAASVSSPCTLIGQLYNGICLQLPELY